MNAACDPHRLLACKIVEQAVLDWRALIRGKNAGAMSSIDEIKCFLQGTWCEQLLSFTDLDGEWVLCRLEAEADRSHKSRKMLTIDGRTENIFTWSKELGVDNRQVYKMYKRQGRAYVESRLAAIKRERDLC